MPKKQKRTEREIHALIVRDAQIRLGCSDFEPNFTLYHVELTSYPAANYRKFREFILAEDNIPNS